MPREACRSCGGPRHAGPICVVCRTPPGASADDPLPDLVLSMMRLGVRAVGDKVTAHPIGLGLAALAFARNEAAELGRADDLAAVLERAAQLIRETLATRNRTP